MNNDELQETIIREQRALKSLVDFRREFISADKEDIRDGMTPEDYVRSLRDYDREEVVF